MSKAKLLMLAAAVSVLPNVASAQTIEELTAAARMAKQKALMTSVASGTTPLPLVNGHSGAPQTVHVPLVDPIGTAPEPKKRRFDDEPYLLSIYGVGSRLVTEIAEDGVAAKYRPGQTTLTGWTVVSIAKTYVELEKRDKRGKTTAKKRLAFWRELDHPEPKADKDASKRQAGAIPPFVTAAPSPVLPR